MRCLSAIIWSTCDARSDTPTQNEMMWLLWALPMWVSVAYNRRPHQGSHQVPCMVLFHTLFMYSKGWMFVWTRAVATACIMATGVMEPPTLIIYLLGDQYYNLVPTRRPAGPASASLIVPIPMFVLGLGGLLLQGLSAFATAAAILKLLEVAHATRSMFRAVSDSQQAVATLFMVTITVACAVMALTGEDPTDVHLLFSLAYAYMAACGIFELGKAHASMQRLRRQLEEAREQGQGLEQGLEQAREQERDTRLELRMERSEVLHATRCPITHDVMKDPVIDNHGHSYERSAIIAWLTLNQRSPFTNFALTANQLIPNRALSEICQALRREWIGHDEATIQ